MPIMESKNKTVDKIQTQLKQYKKVAQDEAKQTRLLIKILISAGKEYLKDKDFELSKEDKEFIKDQSSDIIKLIPLMVFQIIPGGTIATPFLVKLGQKLGIKLNSKIPKKYEDKVDGEMTELVDTDGSFAGSNIPILNQGLHPRKTQDQTVITTRQTNNPVVRGYRVYYGESIEDDENLIDEVDMSDAFGYEETEDVSTYGNANKVLKKMGIEDPFERHDRLEVMGFDPEYDKELKQEKKRGKCKNCFTKRRLAELEKEKMDKMLDEILLSKKSKDKDVVKKTKEESKTNTPVYKILMRNIEAVKRLADKEGIDIEKLVKRLKQGE